MAFIAFIDGDAGSTATLLLALADEQGIDRRSIKTGIGGFFVPAELLVLDGVQVLREPAVPAHVVSDVPKTPPADWYETEIPKADVFADPVSGKVFLTEEAVATLGDEARAQNGTVVGDREIIRAWAKTNGMDVADKGALKREVVDAFNAAQHE